MVMACDIPLWPRSGATAMIRPQGFRALIRALKPLALTPSSLVRKIRGLVMFDICFMLGKDTQKGVILHGNEGA